MSTPRTDEFASQLRGLGTGYYQALEFARSLERDLIAARTLIKGTVGGLGRLASIANIHQENKDEWVSHEDTMRAFLKRTEAE